MFVCSFSSYHLFFWVLFGWVILKDTEIVTYCGFASTVSKGVCVCVYI